MKFAVQCDVPGCKDGQVDGHPCKKCKAGVIVVGAKQNSPAAWILFIAVVISVGLLIAFFHKH